MEQKKIGYKAAKKVARKAVAIAKSQTFDRMYHRLETKEGEKDVFKLARARERKTRDLGVVRCIKDKEGKVLTENDEIRERWQRFFAKLLNGEKVRDDGSWGGDCNNQRPGGGD